MENKKYWWERNKDLSGTRASNLHLLCSLSLEKDVTSQKRYITYLLLGMTFASKEEEKEWLKLWDKQGYCKEFEDMTLTIMERVSQSEMDNLILAYEKIAKDLCLKTDFKRLFEVMVANTHGWVLPISQWEIYWQELCCDEYALQFFLETYKEAYGKKFSREDIYKEFVGFETTPSCMFYKDDLESKTELILDGAFERYAMGLEDEECLEFFKAIIKELL